MDDSDFVTHSIDDLIAHAVEFEDARLASTGGLCVSTGKRTGRSVNDRYIVKDQMTEKTVDWHGMIKPITEANMEKINVLAENYMEHRKIFTESFRVGQKVEHGLNVHAKCEYAWHMLFLKNMFLPYSHDQQPGFGQWQLIALPGLHLLDEDLQLASDVGVFIDFSNKKVTLCGLRYAGEMKKAFFTVMNYYLPDQDVLPMHSACNVDAHDQTTLFLGLSSTGKTSLSADDACMMVGDDEIGWSKDGVFNFEGGCYAKCADLTLQKEPVLHKAALTKATILENVVLDADAFPDFSNTTLSQNTRAAFSRSILTHVKHDNIAKGPESVVFLTCDLFGVLPAVSLLTMEQMRFWFLNGYTAKVGHTQYSVDLQQASSVLPTFSACFGQLFFPRSPMVYADLLDKRVVEQGCGVYLVNTGWYGGGFETGGQRYELSLTKKIIKAIQHGDVKRSKLRTLEGFDLRVPTDLEGIGFHHLNPEQAWPNFTDYLESRQQLYDLCVKNYQKYQIKAYSG